VDMLERDSLTQAYNRAFIEDIITQELARSRRYKLELSLLILKLSKKESEQDDKTLELVGEVVTEHIRLNDYFGKLNDDEYVIVTSNTSLGGAVVLAEKISKRFNSQKIVCKSVDYYFGVTQAGETDSMETVFEKLQDALFRSMQGSKKTIEIEV